MASLPPGQGREEDFAAGLAPADDAVHLRGAAHWLQAEVDLVGDRLALPTGNVRRLESGRRVRRPVALRDLQRERAGRVEELVVSLRFVRVAAAGGNREVRACRRAFPRHAHLDAIDRRAGSVRDNAVEDAPVVRLFRGQKSRPGHRILVAGRGAGCHLQAFGLPAVQRDPVNGDAGERETVVAEGQLVEPEGAVRRRRRLADDLPVAAQRDFHAGRRLVFERPHRAGQDAGPSAGQADRHGFAGAFDCHDPAAHDAPRRNLDVVCAGCQGREAKKPLSIGFGRRDECPSRKGPHRQAGQRLVCVCAAHLAPDARRVAGPPERSAAL